VFLRDHGIDAITVSWPDEADVHPNSLNLIKTRQVDMVINIPKNLSRSELDNATLYAGLPLTTISR